MDSKTPGAAVVEGTVTALVFHNEENGWTVMRMHSGKKQFTAVGYVPGAAPGERFVLTGNWSTHPSYGEQFTADSVSRVTPQGRDAIYEYLAYGAIKGVGPATAHLIVDRFKENALEIIENHPEELEQLRGISHSKALAISKEYKQRTGLNRLMEFVGQAGLKPVLALRLYKLYGDDSVDMLRDNPYILTMETVGADFFEADALALKLGFEGDANERVEAGTIYELRYNASNGHTFLPVSKLVPATAQLLHCDEEPVVTALDMLEDGGLIIRQDFAGLTACYLTAMYSAESSISRRIRQMASLRLKTSPMLNSIIDRVEREQGIEYAPMQRKAVELSASSRVMVLTGGPGTGKTTCLRGISALYKKLGLKTAYAAPTGRAAKRMSELIGEEAQTVHRLLGAALDEERGITFFQKDSEDKLECEAVILDETSMVDVSLMAALLDAMPATCRLVMVGDADQLPPVGPGNVFSDIIRSGIVPTVRLDHVFRQAQESSIIRNAHAINDGQTEHLTENGGDWFFMKRDSGQRTCETIVELFEKRLPNRMGISRQDIQVLSPTRKRGAGTEALNKALQQALNPPAPGKNETTYGDRVFREGDRVMQIRNNYDIVWKRTDNNTMGTGMFNGDMGVIVSIDMQKETVTVDFDGRNADYSFEMLGEMEPAWAVTVHKSQGSEYKAVILAASEVPQSLMTRSLLYTAVTRAKSLLIIVGSPDTAVNMASNDKRQRRYSALRMRLCGEIAE